MNRSSKEPSPPAYAAIDAATRANGFAMPSDPLACSLLRTLAAARPGGTFLELGTGTGLATAWILDGMDSDAKLTSVDHDGKLLAVARKYLGDDPRLNLVEADGATWVRENAGRTFDYIFADTWHGKYLLLDEVLTMLNKGGIYVVDDMLPQENWPEGHAEKAAGLAKYLNERDDLLVTESGWATGVIVAVKR